MRCKDFLTLYSDFRDDLIVDPMMNRRMRQHLEQCQHCARRHHALEIGTQLLREWTPLEPSDRFLVRLRCRLALLRRGTGLTRPAFGWPMSLAATMLVALVVVKGVTPDQPVEDDLLTVAGDVPVPPPEPQRTTAVRARFESLTPPEFRMPPVQFVPARLNLDSALDTWPRVDSGANYVTVHATLTR